MLQNKNVLAKVLLVLQKQKTFKDVNYDQVNHTDKESCTAMHLSFLCYRKVPVEVRSPKTTQWGGPHGRVVKDANL